MSDDVPLRIWPRGLAALAALGALPAAAAIELDAAADFGRPSIDRGWDLVRMGEMQGGCALAVVLAIVIVVLAIRAANGRTSIAVPMSLASLPWALGCAWSVLGAWGASVAATEADPADRASHLALHFARVLAAREVGASLSIGLLSGVAGAWAWSAYAPVTERRVARGLGIGLALGLVITIALPVASMLLARVLGAALPFRAAAMSASQLAWVLLLGLGARGVDRGEASARVARRIGGALAATVAIAWLVAPLTLAASAADAFAAVTVAPTGGRTTMLLRASDEIAAMMPALLLGPAVAALVGTFVARSIARDAGVEASAARPAIGVLLVVIALDLTSAVVARALLPSSDALPLSYFVLP